MKAINYSTNETLGFVPSVNEEKYEAFLTADNTGTGAVKAGEWMSGEDLAALNIKADLTVYFEA